ncbi:MAG: cell division protein FtsQ/DivIB [Caulobacteraceae bacterium]
MTAEALRPAYARARPRAGGISKLAAAKQVGLPAGVASLATFMAAALLVVVYMATGGRGQALSRYAHAAGKSDLASIGFRVNNIHLQGASPVAQKQIIAAANLRTGVPILDVDLAALRARVRDVGWVADAKVIRLLPDTLVIAVAQRPLMAVWEHAGKTVMVADNGALMPDVSPARFATLPLIVGDGANLSAAEILPQIASRPRLAQHVYALVRVDDRRWNLMLKDGGVILLPALDEGTALARLDALDQQAKILDLGFSRIDLRDPELVVVRPRGGAAPALAGGGV